MAEFNFNDVRLAFNGCIFHEVLSETYLPPPHSFILEAGCGTGKLGLAYAIHDETYNVTLLDVDEAQLSRALTLLRVSEEVLQKRLPVTLRLGDARNLPYEDNTFHLVLSEGVAEHWVKEERLRYLSEMARVSRKCMAVAVPDGDDPISQQRATNTVFNYKTMPPKETPPTKDELHSQLENAGWGKITVSKINLVPNVGSLLGIGVKP